VGKGPEPTIALDDGNPKKWVGRCPSTLTQSDCERLLNEAVAAPNGDRDVPVPKKLYVVHNGAIYEAQTSDHGGSYHGYPYKGKLSGMILQSLRRMAEDKKCAEAFEDWVKRYIELHGPRR